MSRTIEFSEEVKATPEDKESIPPAPEDKESKSTPTDSLSAAHSSLIALEMYPVYKLVQACKAMDEKLNSSLRFLEPSDSLDDPKFKFYAKLVIQAPVLLDVSPVHTPKSKDQPTSLKDKDLPSDHTPNSEDKLIALDEQDEPSITVTKPESETEQKSDGHSHTDNSDNYFPIALTLADPDIEKCFKSILEILNDAEFSVYCPDVGKTSQISHWLEVVDESSYNSISRLLTAFHLSPRRGFIHFDEFPTDVALSSSWDLLSKVINEIEIPLYHKSLVYVAVDKRLDLLERGVDDPLMIEQIISEIKIMLPILAKDTLNSRHIFLGEIMRVFNKDSITEKSFLGKYSILQRAVCIGNANLLAVVLKEIANQDIDINCGYSENPLYTLFHGCGYAVNLLSFTELNDGRKSLSYTLLSRGPERLPGEKLPENIQKNLEKIIKLIIEAGVDPTSLFDREIPKQFIEIVKKIKLEYDTLKNIKAFLPTDPSGVVVSYLFSPESSKQKEGSDSASTVNSLTP